MTTQSFPALKAYLEGESEFRAGRFANALEAFQRATATDQSFALVYYRPDCGHVGGASQRRRRRDDAGEACG